MPHATEEEFKFIKCTPAHETFGAEVTGVDFSKPVPIKVFSEIWAAYNKYAVLIFRDTGLDDKRHVEFARQFGELDDALAFLPPGKEHRFPYVELFDVGNVDEDGEVTKIGSKRHHIQMGNYGFHSDLAFNPRRAGASLLRACQLPPKGTGGNTEFADTKTAAEELPADLLKELEDNEYIGAHSLIQSRIREGPKDSPWFKDFDPEQHQFGRHSLLQVHEGSGRPLLYTTNHLHHLEYKTPRSPDFVPTAKQPFERVPQEIGWPLINKLLEYGGSDKYVLSVQWHNNGDMIIWDNTGCMHRAGKGTFTAQGFKRDLRRCTAHDDSDLAYGFNDPTTGRQTMTYKP